MLNHKDKIWHLAAGLTLLFAGLPAFAAPTVTVDANAFLNDGAGLQPISDDALRNSHGKGVDPNQVRPQQSSVILWDEAGPSQGRSAGGSTGTGNIQTVSLSLSTGGGK